jgi:3',5'-nucleoside bisphosphate phosphatase
MSRPTAPPGGRRVDLHTHTLFSDGTLSPESLVKLAVERQLAALSITDHDSLEALGPARVAAGAALELVPGIELSSAMEGVELHLLGYYIDPLDDALRQRLEVFRSERLQRAHAMIARLRELGFPVDPEEVVANAGPGVVGRPHVAAALVRAGHAENMDDAFRRFLGRGGVAFIPRPAFHPREAISLIHAAGGLSVLAHPGALLAVHVVEQLVEMGLRGIEIWHPQHGIATIRRWRAAAARLHLLETGGSDFHGPDRGMDLGELGVPVAALTRLKEAAGVPG